MSGKTVFSVDLMIPDISVFPELAERLKDFSPFFNQVIDDWTSHNEDKFKLGEGAEESGADVGGGVFWEGLTPAYLKRKMKQGLAGSLMHATGQLESAMSTRDLLFEAITDSQAVFGVPTDSDDEMKIRGNWKTRQVIFLDEEDEKNIKDALRDFLNVEPADEGFKFLSRLAASRERNLRAKGLVEY